MKDTYQIINNNQTILLLNTHLLIFGIDNKIDPEEMKSIQQFLERNKLANDFLEWKLRKLLLIYRLLFKQCEQSISKRLLLQLISFQILQITSSNEKENDQNNEEQQQNKINNKTIIEMHNKLIEFIVSKKNSNLNNKTRNQTKLVSFLKKFQ